MGLTLDVFFSIILVVLAILGFKSITIIRPHQKGVVEKFGRYDRLLNSGLSFIIPFAENARKVDLRETVLDVPPQEVITKDNVVVTVDAVVFFKVVNPVNVLYNVAVVENAIHKLAQTFLRDVIGGMELDATLGSRDSINIELMGMFKRVEENWGVHITRVEIQHIDPPKDITDAMSRQMKAERTKRAAIIEAEGARQAEILKAEGEKQSGILKAEGDAHSKKIIADAEKYKKLAIAEGEAEAILNIFKAIHQGEPTKELLIFKYLESLEKIADGKATKIFLPLEAVGVLGGIAGLGEVFRESKMGEKRKTSS